MKNPPWAARARANVMRAYKKWTNFESILIMNTLIITKYNSIRFTQSPDPAATGVPPRHSR